MVSRPTEIVYFAVNRWDSMVQREQHLMLGLSRFYRVLFIDPPLSFLTTLWGRQKKETWTFKSHLYRVNDQLIVYTPPAFPPWSQHSKWMNRFHTHLLIRLAKGVLEKLSFKIFILGIGRPFLGGTIKPLRPTLSFYDCADEYVEFPGLRANKRFLKKSEEELLQSVDLVFCTSQGLKVTKSHFNRNCFLLPNGVDVAPFDRAAMDPRIPSDIEKIRKPILGYIGTIGEWLDFNTLAELAKTRPDWSIVMIGPLASPRFSPVLSNAPNIHWLGQKDYQELHPYLKMFDVCLIPFKVNDFTRKIYPTKLHQYFAVGKPVLSSHLPDLEPFIPWVEFYSDAKEMEIKIERSLREDSEEKVLGRKRVAQENTWERRVDTMIHILNTFFKE